MLGELNILACHWSVGFTPKPTKHTSLALERTSATCFLELNNFCILRLQLDRFDQQNILIHVIN
jgi:hypothetical protein